MENGFYKIDNGELLFGQYIESLDYKLSLDTKDNYTYPIDGWYYFETIAIARQFFNIVPEQKCCECPPDDGTQSPLPI